jgi:hypothetical protein
MVIENSDANFFCWHNFSGADLSLTQQKEQVKLYGNAGLASAKTAIGSRTDLLNHSLGYFTTFSYPPARQDERVLSLSSSCHSLFPPGPGCEQIEGGVCYRFRSDRAQVILLLLRTNTFVTKRARDPVPASVDRLLRIAERVFYSYAGAGKLK